MTNQPNPYEPPQSSLQPAGRPPPLLRTFDDAPIAVFQYLFGDQWIQSAQRRLMQSAAEVKWFWRLLTVLLLGSAVVTVVAVFELLPPMANRAIVVVVAALAVLLILRANLSNSGNQSALQQFRQAKSYNCMASSFVHRDGLVNQNSYLCAAMRWEMFSSGVHFPDGFLLMAEGQIFWLPIADLTPGRIDDVEAILREKIADYKEMRH